MEPTVFWIIIVILVIWELCCKGIGLWRAAQAQQLYWFIAILVLNTVGILPLIYILFFEKEYD